MESKEVLMLLRLREEAKREFWERDTKMLEAVEQLSESQKNRIAALEDANRRMNDASVYLHEKISEQDDNIKTMKDAMRKIVAAFPKTGWHDRSLYRSVCDLSK